MRQCAWVSALMLVVALWATDARAVQDPPAQEPSQALDFPSYVGYAAPGHAMAWTSTIALTVWPILLVKYHVGEYHENPNCDDYSGDRCHYLQDEGVLAASMTLVGVGSSSLLVGIPLMMKSLRMAIGTALAAGVEDVGGPAVRRRQIAAWIFYALALSLPPVDWILSSLLWLPVPSSALFATIAVLLAESAWSRVNRQIRDAGMVVEQQKVSLVPGVAPIEGGASLVLSGAY